MIKIQTRRILAYTLLGLCFLALSAFAPSGGPVYEITWYTIDTGGGSSFGANYEVTGTIGQSDPATQTGVGYEMTGGFWPAFVELRCPGDTNGDNVVSVSDLLELLTSWGVCGIPCPSDIDNNGQVSVSDLLSLLTNWGVCS